MPGPHLLQLSQGKKKLANQPAAEQMKKYLEETKFAVSSLIELVWTDFKILENLNEQLKALLFEFDFKHEIFLANEYHPAANYYHAQAAKAYEKMAQPKAEMERKIKETYDSIDAKSASISALSGAILQIAKQCISLNYGKPQNAPDGTNIQGIPVKLIIWEGRNQSIHYENPKEISEHVVKIFENLDAVRADGKVWDPKSQRNFAFEIIKFLGWRTYDDFEDHLKSIKGKK